MTAQSKNARKLAKAHEISRMHKNGDKGPSKTTPKHEKRWTYRSNPEIAKRIVEMVKATADKGKTVLDKLNDQKAKNGKLSSTAAERD
jgi:hypothetical protein